MVSKTSKTNEQDSKISSIAPLSSGAVYTSAQDSHGNNLDVKLSAHKSRPKIDGRKLTHTFLSPKSTLILGVFIPTFCVLLYLIFVAANQYASTTLFTVRSSSGQADVALLGFLSQGAPSSSSTDAYFLEEFVTSKDMLLAVEEDIDLQAVYSKTGNDFYFKMSDGLLIEDRLSYWRKMVSIAYNPTTHILALEVRAFEPEDAVAISKIIVEESSSLINRMSDEAQVSSLKLATTTLGKSELRLRMVQRQLEELRNQEQFISPESDAEGTSKILQELISNRTKLQGELDYIRSQLSDDAPRVERLQSLIEVTNKQIANVRNEIGSDNNNSSSIASKVSRYEDLVLEKEFAQKAYVASLAARESALLDAQRTSKFLGIIQKPTIAEASKYPNVPLLTLTVFIGLGAIWAVFWLVLANIKNRPTR